MLSPRGAGSLTDRAAAGWMVFFGAIVSLSVLLTGGHASALSLSPSCVEARGDAALALEQADAVFIGTVVDRVMSAGRDQPAQTASEVELKLKVERSYKGSERELWLHYDDPNGDPAPFVGERLLVFADRIESRWLFNYCAPSRRLGPGEDAGILEEEVPPLRSGCGRCDATREGSASWLAAVLVLALVRLAGWRRSNSSDVLRD